MKKEILASAIVLVLGLGVSAQDHKQQHDAGSQQAKANEMLNKMKEEAAAYYAGADSAEYGVRYRLN